jgi:carbamate kinase
MIGYMLAQALGSELPGRDVVAVLTQVLVDPDDPGFVAPTKPIGPVYSEQEARALAADRGWTIAPDGEHFRRVVASPEPKGIVELEAIERLVAGGSVVICAGGGGIPVVVDGDGLHGVEAVIDKDLTAALLAEALGAERLIVLNDVSGIKPDW